MDAHQTNPFLERTVFISITSQMDIAEATQSIESPEAPVLARFICQRISLSGFFRSRDFVMTVRCDIPLRWRQRIEIMRDIENELDRLAEKLPDGYEVQICVENGAAWLQVITPSGDTVPIDGDCETCWAMLIRDALGFCLTDYEQNRVKSHTQPC